MDIRECEKEQESSSICYISPRVPFGASSEMVRGGMILRACTELNVLDSGLKQQNLCGRHPSEICSAFCSFICDIFLKLYDNARSYTSRGIHLNFEEMRNHIPARNSKKPDLNATEHVWYVVRKNDRAHRQLADALCIIPKDSTTPTTIGSSAP